MRTRIILISLVILLIQPVVADNITIKFEEVKMPTGEFRYWFGEGVLISDAKGNINIDMGDSRIVSYSGIEINNEVIYADNPEILFTVPKPSGHGVYKVEFDLPKIKGPTDLTIEIENGKAIFFSNIDFKVEEYGNILRLHAKTDERHIKFYFITELAYMLFSNFAAASLFILVLFVYLIVKRKDVRKSLGSNLAKLKRSSPATIQKYDGGYMVEFPKPVEISEKMVMLKIPSWLISGLLIIFLAIVFVELITKPIREHWNLLGSFGYAVLGVGAVVGLLSAILLLSSPDERAFVKRISFIGGGLVGMMFGYLSWLALVLFVTTTLLIYYLSILVLEEEESEGD